MGDGRQRIWLWAHCVPDERFTHGERAVQRVAQQIAGKAGLGRGRDPKVRGHAV